MNYEKKYKEALEWARKVMQGEVGFVLDEVLEKFPELKESEDERIRKELIDFLEYYRLNNVLDSKTILLLTDSVAWLEKQGEQKSEVKYVYTKFRVGDVIVEIKPDGYCQPVTVKYIGEGDYLCESDDGKRFLSFPIISQDKYELVEQKPWSEEDETGLTNIIIMLKEGASHHFSKDDIVKGVDWLKSLKGRYTWKPSEEQMNTLEYYMHTLVCNEYKEILFGLYTDLKKLREE